ncbi:MAG: MoaD/ThiS family protein [Phycisphaeraceae bacterium]|nr:MoaD/ThiS family protein [Phycisphaeraceae bacterium]
MSQDVHVLIPNALRSQAGNLSSVSVQATSIRDALDALCTQFPELKARLFKDGQQLNRFVNVYLNDEDIRFLKHLDTEIHGGDEISIVPAIAGG